MATFRWERGEDGVPSCNRAERYKQERAPRAFAQGAVSHGRPVLTGRNGESAAARRSGAHKNEEAPHEVYLMGGVNPATTYSPGPGGQVPSAI